MELLWIMAIYAAVAGPMMFLTAWIVKWAAKDILRYYYDLRHAEWNERRNN